MWGRIWSGSRWALQPSDALVSALAEFGLWLVTAGSGRRAPAWKPRTFNGPSLQRGEGESFGTRRWYLSARECDLV